MTIIAAPVFADPCTYLTQRECSFEKKYCEFQPEFNSVGRCQPAEVDKDDVSKKIICDAPNGSFWINKGEYKRSQYCQSNGCEWTPSVYEPAGCYLKADLF